MESELEKCDSLADSLQYEQEMKELNSLLEKNPQNVEVLWRLARCYFNIGEEKPETEWRKKNWQKGYESAKKAIESDGNHWAAHKWMAIMISKVNEFSPITEKAKNVPLIKEHALKAAELNPKDANTQHVLGQWCFAVANADFISRTALSAFVSTSSTNEEALKYFLKCEELSSTPNYRNWVYIGDCYKNMKKKDDAATWYKKVVDAKVESSVDAQYQQEAKKKLEEVSKSSSSWWQLF